MWETILWAQDLQGPQMPQVYEESVGMFDYMHICLGISTTDVRYQPAPA